MVSKTRLICQYSIYGKYLRIVPIFRSCNKADRQTIAPCCTWVHISIILSLMFCYQSVTLAVTMPERVEVILAKVSVLASVGMCSSESWATLNSGEVSFCQAPQTSITRTCVIRKNYSQNYFPWWWFVGIGFIKR